MFRPRKDALSDAIREQVIAELRTLYDPEIPVNIWDLGLIYELKVDRSGRVDIQMTLTSPNCPVAESLPPAVEQAAASVPGVTAVRLDLVWEPPWGPEHLSEAARLELGMD